MIGNMQVQQVDSDGNLIEGYDVSLSISQLYTVILDCFPNIYRDEENMICGQYKGNKYAIRMKNITYLGIQHPKYKKRIQIPNDLHQFYKKAKKNRMRPILLGVYNFGDNLLFCDFNIEDYIEKKANNSSAHVYTGDLSSATINGIYQKKDSFGNMITVFRKDMVEVYFDNLFNDSVYINDSVSVNDNNYDYYTHKGDVLFQKINFGTRFEKNASSILSEKIIKSISDFFVNEKKIWHGIECYQKMIEDDYRNKFQPEWAGFFLEYEFEKYIQENGLDNMITYAQDKSKNGIDLDLYFPELGVYGDLKAHSEYSRGIQGNDWDTIFHIINLEEGKNHVFYIICEHSTEKDSEHNFEVTRFWNDVRRKDNLMSYAKRMKNCVELKKTYILDINKDNKEYLSMFKQGVNSNGKLRAPKILIEQDKIKHFLIFELEL